MEKNKAKRGIKNVKIFKTSMSILKVKYTFKNIKTSEGFLLGNFIFNVLHLKSSFRENRKPLELIRHTYTLTEQAQY